jgi:hypothetical protein
MKNILWWRHFRSFFVLMQKEIRHGDLKTARQVFSLAFHLGIAYTI